MLNFIGDKNVAEPYRLLLRNLIAQVRTTRDWLQAQLENRPFPIANNIELIHTSKQLREPLEICYRSLCENKLDIIANGLLLDTLRRLACFDVTLTKLDLRQESTRHAEAMEEIVAYISPDEDKYSNWSEEKKQEFLLKEISSKRPLISHRHKWTHDTEEVLNTFRIIGQGYNHEALGLYIISMAKQPSDVLTVAVLMKELSNKKTLPV